MRRWMVGVVLAAGVVVAPQGLAQGAEVAGVKFPGSVQVGSAKLQLNGAGVRYKLVFKVYAAGLYLAEKTSTAEAVLAAPGAKHLRVVMLRDIDGKELGKLFTQGMEQNATRDEFGKSISGIVRMSDLFSSRKRLAAGDQFSVEWAPGVGTVISVNGKVEGEPVKEPEFYAAMMKIWLGKAPADAQLKEALLGRAAAPPGGGT